MEHTLSILKPDTVRKHKIGAVINYLEKGGLSICAMKMTHLTKEQAEEFYAIHKERPFFADLISFMTSGPIVALALYGENAVSKNREIMGATNPKEANPGTIRKDFADSIDENAVHGSDSLENAAIEIDFFFKNDPLFQKKHAHA